MTGRPPGGGWARQRYAEHRQQPGRPSAQQRRGEQGQRIEVDVTAPQPPVQTAGGAVRRPWAGHCDRLPRGHLVARPDLRAHGLVREAQRGITTPGHLDGEDPAPGHLPGEHDRAGGRRQHGSSRRGGEIDAAVARPVRTGRRFPPPYDEGPSGERPGPVAGRFRHPRHGRRPGAGTSQQHREQCCQCGGSCPPSGSGQAGGRSRCAVHDVTISRQPVPRGTMVRICGRRSGCGHRRHPAPDGSRTLLLAIRVTGSTSHAPPPPSLRGGRAPRSLVARRVGASGATANPRSR